MAKYLVLLCVALVIVTLTEACTGPGMPCGGDDDCCGTFSCNPWSGRCGGSPALAPRTGPMGNNDNYGYINTYGNPFIWRWRQPGFGNGNAGWAGY